MKLLRIIVILLNIILIASSGVAAAAPNSIEGNTACIDYDNTPLYGVSSSNILGTEFNSLPCTLEHTLPMGPVFNVDFLMGVAYNPNSDTYWQIDGGISPSYIYEQTSDGNVITSATVPLDGRAIVYRPQDGNVYIRTFTGHWTENEGLYRLNLPFDGTITKVHGNIFQNEQSGVAFANGGNIFEVYNGVVYEYDFNTGSLLRSFSLNPIYPSGNVGPYNCQIASDGLYLYFMSNPDDIYQYDINGNLLCMYELDHPSFDIYKAPYSLSYTNDRLYVLENNERLIYGYSLSPVIIYSPQAVTNDSSPMLNSTFLQTASLAWYVLDGNNGTNQTNTDYLNVTLPQLDDGMHNITVYAMDSEGNITDATQDFLVDTIEPEINIEQVRSPASVNVFINGTFIEEGAGIASVVVNGVSATLNEENNSYSATGLPLLDGENLITIFAMDKAGNTGTAEMNITVDAVPPVLNITQPTGDSIWFVDNIVKGMVSDPNFESASLLVRNETGVLVSQYELDILSNNTFRERVEYYPKQLNTLELIAYDVVGNSNISRKMVYVENSTIQEEVSAVNKSKAVVIDSVNETGTSIEFVSDINATNVTFTVTAITNETEMEGLNSSAFGELAVGKMVEINATGGLDGSNESQVQYVLISLFYTMDDLDLDGDGEIGPGDIDESSLYIYWYNETSGNWTKLIKGNPDWVLDSGRSPLTGGEQGSLWVKVEHLSSYSLTGALIPDSLTSESPEHKSGSGFGHAVIISNSEVSKEDDLDSSTPYKQYSDTEELDIPLNEILEEDTPEKEMPVEVESKNSPGFGLLFVAAGLVVSAVCLRRKVL